MPIIEIILTNCIPNFFTLQVRFQSYVVSSPPSSTDVVDSYALKPTRK